MHNSKPMNLLKYWIIDLHQFISYIRFVGGGMVFSVEQASVDESVRFYPYVLYGELESCRVCMFFFGWRRFESGTYLYVHIAQWCHRNNAGWWCKKLQHPPALTDDCNFANWTFLQVYEWKRLKSLIYNSCYAECRASNKFVHISSGRRKEKLQKNGVYLQWMEWGCGEKRKKMCVRVFWVPQNRI